MNFKTQNNRVSLSALLMGLSETHKANGKRLRLWLEAGDAINVAVEDKHGKIIHKQSFRYVPAARKHFDELKLVIA